MRSDDPLGIGASGWYETLLSGLLSSIAKPWHSFVDVGANVGWYSCLLAPHVKSVVAFEPEEESHRVLLLNTSVHPNIRCVKAAVGDRAGASTLAVNPGNTADSRIVSTASKWPVQHIDVVKLDDAVDSADVIKVDVQGWELGVLSGGGRCLHSATALAIELTPGMAPGGMDGTKEVIRMICEAGFNRFIAIRRRCNARVVDRDALLKAVAELGRSKDIDVLCLKL